MFKLYKDNAGEWRWKLVAKNNETIADSSEGYRRRYEAAKAVERVKKLVAEAEVIEVLSEPQEAPANGTHS